MDAFLRDFGIEFAMRYRGYATTQETLSHGAKRRLPL